MTISDLSCLAAAEITIVTGGSGYFSQYVDQYNDAYVVQYADSSADAESFRGNAYGHFEK